MKMRIAQCATVIGLATAVMTATAALPSGYLEFEYIQGNGSNARIVTDYTPNPSTDKIEVVFQFPANALANNVNHAIWCARSDGSVKTWTLFVLGTSYRFDYNTTQNAVSGTAINTTEKYTVTVDGNQFSSSGSNGSSHSSSPAAVAGFTSTVQPLVLFSSYTSNTDNNKTNYGKHKLYSFKVWRSGALIHDFVPAKRNSDSREGLYDVAANKFYAGTGSFTMGGVEFFHYDDGTALHGYQSYAEWLASANVGSSDASFTAEAELEARYRTMGESDGIALRSDWGRPLIIIVR